MEVQAHVQWGNVNGRRTAWPVTTCSRRLGKSLDLHPGEECPTSMMATSTVSCPLPRHPRQIGITMIPFHGPFPRAWVTAIAAPANPQPIEPATGSSWHNGVMAGRVGELNGMERRSCSAGLVSTVYKRKIEQFGWLRYGNSVHVTVTPGLLLSPYSTKAPVPVDHSIDSCSHATFFFRVQNGHIGRSSTREMIRQEEIS